MVENLSHLYDLPRPSHEGAGAPGRVWTVMIVDDSPAHLALTQRMLESWGYKVVTVDSGDGALDALSIEPVDMVVCDWIMPGMTGLEFCEAARSRIGGEFLYIVMLTSKRRGEDVATGIASGADDFISKPVDRNELRARMRAGERLVSLQRAVIHKNREAETALDALQAVYEDIERDLREARRLQDSLVPDRQRWYPHADVALYLKSSGHVGGDLVGGFALTDQRIALYSIDVSGHGIASALMTARLAGYFSGSSPLQNIALQPDGAGGFEMRPPAEACATMNELLMGDIETELYFTIALADCDLATGNVRLAQAGHPHPLIQRADGSIEQIGEGGMPVGLIDQAEFPTVETRLNPGDRLLLHSDGFSEATSAEGTMLEMRGLQEILADHKDRHGDACLSGMVDAVTRFTGRSEFDDDLSAILLEYTGPR